MRSTIVSIVKIVMLLLAKTASFLSDLSRYPGLGWLRPVKVALRRPLEWIAYGQERLQGLQVKAKTTRSKAKSLASAVRKDN